MAYKDLHDKPFDKGTIAKLEIFEDYAQAWLPTFVMKGDPEIHIFDFFSGPGYDSNGVPGTPIRLLSKINEQLGNILQKKTKVVLHLNEYEPNKKSQLKFESLINNCNAFFEAHPKFKYFLLLKFYNTDAEELFFELLPQMSKYPSLVFLDQNGVKFISKEYIQELEKLKANDFLYFVSSSYFKWLGTTEEFKRVIEFDAEELDRAKQTNMHRVVIGKLKSFLTEDSELKLFPFSIKKGSNIFGIIFGATHYRAVDKFLEISWKKNELNGEADFDIDKDRSKGQLDIFGSKAMTKIEKFKLDLEQRILAGKIKNNKDALKFTYETGNFYRYANDLIKDMKKQGILSYQGKTPGVSYQNVFNWKTAREIDYEIIK